VSDKSNTPPTLLRGPRGKPNGRPLDERRPKRLRVGGPTKRNRTNVEKPFSKTVTKRENNARSGDPACRARDYPKSFPRTGADG